MTDLQERLESEERFYREAGQTKGPYVHHSPGRCTETADLLKEAREASKKPPQNMGQPTAFEREHPGYYAALMEASADG